MNIDTFDLKSVSDGDKAALKAKVATLYNRINKAYPDATPLVPPWKGKSMDEPLQRKDFNDEYRQRQISNWRSGWYSLTCALNAAVMDGFDVGDMPMDDAMAALNGSEGSPGFIDAFKEWVQDGIDLNFSDYLDALEQNDSPSYYGYMSNDAPHEQKAGATYSAASKATISKHVSAVHEKADKLHAMATGLASTTGIDDTATTKAGATFSQSTKDMLTKHVTDLHGEADELDAMADDLAETTGATTYDDSTGKPATDTTKSASPPQQAPGTSPSTDHPPSVEDTDEEEIDESEVDMAIARLKLGLLTRSTRNKDVQRV